jgi:hypothetical protein
MAQLFKKFFLRMLKCFLCVQLQNENRYNVGKGTHIVLKRAEKARALVSKMPGEHRMIYHLVVDEKHVFLLPFPIMNKALMVLCHW